MVDWRLPLCELLKDRIRIKQNRSYPQKKRRERASEIYGARIEAKPMMLDARSTRYSPGPIAPSRDQTQKLLPKVYVLHTKGCWGLTFHE